MGYPLAPAAVIRGLQLLQKTGVRGRTRLTFLLARHWEPLQAVPVQIADWPPVYMDLRRYDAHDWLRGTPWTESPRELGEQRIMRRVVRQGDCAFDIGANIGLHTALLSNLVGPSGAVVAFEPNPVLLPALRKTISGMGNTKLLECGLSNQNTEMDLYVPSEDLSTASLADWTAGRCGAVATARVPVKQLDELDLPAPGFIKCDIEGGELFAFQGGAGLLDRKNPILLFEANVHTAAGFGLTIDSTRAFLASLPEPKYHFFAVDEKGDAQEVDRITGVHWNVLAVPEVKLPRLA